MVTIVDMTGIQRVVLKLNKCMLKKLTINIPISTNLTISKITTHERKKGMIHTTVNMVEKKGMIHTTVNMVEKKGMIHTTVDMVEKKGMIHTTVDMNNANDVRFLG